MKFLQNHLIASNWLVKMPTRWSFASKIAYSSFVLVGCLAMATAGSAALAQSNTVTSSAVEDSQPTQAIVQQFNGEALALTKRAINSYFLPGYERINQQAELLEGALSSLCESPSEKQLVRVRSAFQQLVLASERLAFIHFGPISEDSRQERLLFWPDRRGIGRRQVQKVLQQQDDSAINADSLRQKSAALQGLTSLEYALFGGVDSVKLDQELLQPQSFRCAYAAANAQVIHRLTTTVLQGWEGDATQQGFAALLSSPSAENYYYRNQKEVLAELVGLLSSGLAEFRDRRVLPLLGKIGEEESIKLRPKKALFWRSGTTLHAMQANIEGLRHLVDLVGFETIIDDDERWIMRSIQIEFDNIERVLNSFTKSESENQQVDGKLLKEKWNYVLLISRNLQRLIGEELASKLGFAVGFSPLDGD